MKKDLGKRRLFLDLAAAAQSTSQMYRMEKSEAKRDVVLTEILIRLEKMEKRLRFLERAKSGDGRRTKGRRWSLLGR